eukprot:53700-Pyramimonas_sp.AAC.2
MINGYRFPIPAKRRRRQACGPHLALRGTKCVHRLLPHLPLHPRPRVRAARALAQEPRKRVHLHQRPIPRGIRSSAAGQRAESIATSSGSPPGAG